MHDSTDENVNPMSIITNEPITSFEMKEGRGFWADMTNRTFSKGISDVVLEVQSLHEPKSPGSAWEEDPRPPEVIDLSQGSAVRPAPGNRSLPFPSVLVCELDKPDYRNCHFSLYHLYYYF